MVASREQIDSEIVLLAQAGDVEAFTAIHQFYRPYVYGICLKMRRNSSDAEDLTQEVFIHLFRFLPGFRWEAKFSTWLYRMAVSVVLWKCRPKRVVTISISDQEYDDRSPRIIDEGIEDPSLRGAADRLTLYDLLSELSPVHMETVILHDLYGFSAVEIAKMNNLKKGTSQANCRRARAALQSLAERHTSFVGKRKSLHSSATSSMIS